MKLSVSAPSLGDLFTSQLHTQITSVASATMLTQEEDSTSRFAGTSPNDYFQQIVKAANLSFQTHPSLSLHDFFLEITPEHIDGYQTDLIAAIRNDDIHALRELYESGRTLQACNKFGESVVHIACRRGSTEIVRFLLEVAGVSVRLRDDYGRTPLHDALWTQKPEFDCVEIILRACPDLLLVTDKRGFTPLSYVRRDHWVAWCAFLESHQDLVLPKELI
jgi:ankyrin repeat protein